uniref:Transcriptional regulators n=1 Tax=uncultured delta proteobacterium HF0130_20J24 TaxID=710829 RepID=E0XXS7_9DELT|nr:transcriptional regulators [uncultured delta proteobacterium HF0130_20J24]
MVVTINGLKKGKIAERRRSREVRINDLALELGLTKGTVSRALNGYEDISIRTRKRVTQVARMRGYVPTTQARRLAMGHTETVGLVLPPMPSEPVNTFVSEFIHSISSALNVHGYDLLVHSINSEESEVEQYKRLVQSRKIDGFIILRTLELDPRVDYLLDEGFPFVTHGRTARMAEHDWFDIDGEKAFRDATSHLIKLGHQMVGFVGGGIELFSAKRRLNGYRTMMERIYHKKITGLEQPGDLTGLGGETAARNLLKQNPPPTAILCANDATALGVIKAARELGFQIPKHLSVIGYDGIALGGYLDPPLTTLTFSIKESGEQIVKMLLRRLKEPNLPFFSKLASATLKLRGSEGPPAKDFKN